MNSPFPKISLPPSRPAVALALAFLCITLLNLFPMKKEMGRIRDLKKLIPHQVIGYQFEGLNEVLKGVSHVGYYTDKDLSQDEDAAKLFSYAQYVLAPIILDLDNTDHHYTIFVYDKESTAQAKMKELNFEAFRGNPYGMILARRKY